MATSIIQDSQEVTSTLSFFDVSKKELTNVAIEAASQRNNATALQPKNAGGLFSYIYGVEALRLIFLPKDGWIADSTNGVESVFNPELNIKILFQNVDQACGFDNPRPISGKGSGVKELLQINTEPYLFPHMQDEDDSYANRNIWFFCVSSNGEDVRAELSLPLSIEGKQFSSFQKRIFILTDNDWSPTDPIDEVDFDDNLQDFDVSVTRK